jgi:DHA1 family tetracycline resistance protein-like MFS transporter
MTSLGRFLRSPLFPIFLIVFTDVVGMGMIIPVLPLFAKDDLGATPMQIALLATVYSLAQLVAAPRLGRLSDRVGRRPVLILSQFGTLSAMLLTAWAPHLAILYLARVLDGFTAGNVSAAFAYVSDVAEPKDRARAMGVINAGFGAGFMFGPALGGLLGGAYGPRVPFLVAAGVSLLSITLAYFRLREPERQRAPDAAQETESPSERPLEQGGEEPPLTSLPGVKWLFAMGAGMQMAMLTFTSTWVLWADEVLVAGYPEAQQQRLIGYVFAVIGTCGLLTQAFLVGPLVRRFGERKLIFGGLLLRGSSFSAMGAFPVLPATFAIAPMMSLGGGLSVPSIMATLTNSVPGHRRGQALGAMNAWETTGRLVGPVLGGALFELVSPSAPLFAGGAICMLTAFLTFGIPRSVRGHPEEEPMEAPA